MNNIIKIKDKNKSLELKQKIVNHFITNMKKKNINIYKFITEHQLKEIAKTYE